MAEVMGGTAAADMGGGELEWAQCDICNKWRELPEGYILNDDGRFECSEMPGLSCGVKETDWTTAPAFPRVEGEVGLEYCQQRLEFLIWKLSPFSVKGGQERQKRMVDALKNATTVPQVVEGLRNVAANMINGFFRRDWEEENKQEWLELLGDVTSWQSFMEAGWRFEEDGPDWNRIYGVERLLKLLDRVQRWGPAFETVAKSVRKAATNRQMVGGHVGLASLVRGLTEVAIEVFGREGRVDARGVKAVDVWRGFQAKCDVMIRQKQLPDRRPDWVSFNDLIEQMEAFEVTLPSFALTQTLAGSALAKTTPAAILPGAIQTPAGPMFAKTIPAAIRPGSTLQAATTNAVQTSTQGVVSNAEPFALGPHPAALLKRKADHIVSAEQAPSNKLSKHTGRDSEGIVADRYGQSAVSDVGGDAGTGEGRRLREADIRRPVQTTAHESQDLSERYGRAVFGVVLGAGRAAHTPPLEVIGSPRSQAAHARGANEGQTLDGGGRGRPGMSLATPPRGETIADSPQTASVKKTNHNKLYVVDVDNPPGMVHVRQEDADKRGEWVYFWLTEAEAEQRTSDLVGLDIVRAAKEATAAASAPAPSPSPLRPTKIQTAADGGRDRRAALDEDGDGGMAGGGGQRGRSDGRTEGGGGGGEKSEAEAEAERVKQRWKALRECVTCPQCPCQVVALYQAATKGTDQAGKVDCCCRDLRDPAHRIRVLEGLSEAMEGLRRRKEFKPAELQHGFDKAMSTWVAATRTALREDRSEVAAV